MFEKPPSGGFSLSGPAISLAAHERGYDEPPNLGRPLVGVIALRPVAFRYAEIERNPAPR